MERKADRTAGPDTRILFTVLVCVGLLLGIPGPAAGQDTIPLDPAIHAGQLENGLRYFIRENHRPEQRAELRLVVNAGSVLEEEDQRGLAHFLEHMAFNGTRSFEKQELVQWLESIGMQFGPDVNAYTGFDETVYMLQIPTDQSGIVDTAFQVLREWAGDIVLEPGEVEKERGVVIEEWRLSRGAGARLLDAQLPVLLNDSRYADRLPIGTVDVLESFDPKRLSDFYSQWYRPDLMSVVVVGDVNARVVEQRIRTLFSDLPNPPNAPERVFFDVPAGDDILYSLETDPEATSARVEWSVKHRPHRLVTEQDYRMDLVASLRDDMLGQRLYERTQVEQPPYVAAGGGSSELVRTSDAYSLVALARDGRYLGAFQALMEEAERVRRFGFTLAELDRARTNLLRSLEVALNEQDKTQSSRHAAELVRHVLTDEAVPGIAHEVEMAREFLGTITLAEIHDTMPLTEQGRVLMVSGPERDDWPLPDSTELMEVLGAVRASELEPYSETVSDAPLVAEVPTPGTVVSERSISEIGVTEWTLSNGITVVLKPTDFKNDEVVLSATSDGGLSVAATKDLLSAEFATTLIGQGGVGTFGPLELQKKLTGKAVSVSAGISRLSEGFTASASPQDLETMFQLVYLRATQPRADSVVFASYVNRLRSVVEQSAGSPARAFSDTLSTTLSSYNPRSRPLTVERLSELDLGKAFAFYKDRFSDFDDFVFTITGSFSPNEIRPLVETWLATLPTRTEDDTWMDEGIDAPAGIVEKEVHKGLEQQSQVAIIFHGATEWSVQARREHQLMQTVLEARLRELLREDLGGTYGVQVSGSLTREPHEQYRTVIVFGCAPDRVDELIRAVTADLESLRSSGPSEVHLRNAVQQAVRAHEVGMQDNSYWVRQLEAYRDFGLDPRRIPEAADVLATVSIEDIRHAADRFMAPGQYVQVVLYPGN